MGLEYLLRLVVAGFCGALIGFERKSRMKEAGLRTHFLVAIGSALIMVVSEYGFLDMLGNSPNIRLDPSRLAAQVVSGIGFLGAGTIIVQRQSIRGLTTAAGLWSTSGIGLAIGAGMYWVGFGATILVLVGLEILDRGFKWLFVQRPRLLTLSLRDDTGALRKISRILEENEISISKFHIDTIEETTEVILEFELKIPRNISKEEILGWLAEIPSITDAQIR